MTLVLPFLTVAAASIAVVPLMLIAIAEYENRYLDAYGLEFASRLGDAQGRAPWFVQLRGHNHTSAVAHFNTDEDWFGRHIFAFLKS